MAKSKRRDVPAEPIATTFEEVQAKARGLARAAEFDRRLEASRPKRPLGRLATDVSTPVSISAQEMRAIRRAKGFPKAVGERIERRSDGGATRRVRRDTKGTPGRPHPKKPRK